MARCFVAAGLTKNDIIHNAYGYGLFTGGLGAHYGAEKLGASVIPMSGGNTKRQIMILQDFGPTAICCTPSYALNLAEQGKAMGVDMRVPEAPGRDLRRRALEREDAAGDRKRPGDHGAQHLRPLRDHGPRGRHGMPGGPPRDAHLRGPFPRRDDQPGNRRGAAAGRRGGARLHDDHEGGLPPDPLPDAGHLPPAARNPAGAAGRSTGWTASRAAATTC